MDYKFRFDTSTSNFINSNIHLNIPLYKKQEKLIHDFILYTRNFLHEMGSRYCINNENETCTLHFMLSYKYSTYQIFMDTCNEKQYQNNISTYDETKNMR